MQEQNGKEPPAQEDRASARLRWLASIEALIRELAHEVRNPLNGAKLQLTLIRRLAAASGAERVITAADVARSEIDRTADVVTRFLDSIAPPRGAKAPASLKVICESAASQAAGALGERCSVSVDLPEEDADLCVDGLQLIEALAASLSYVSSAFVLAEASLTGSFIEGEVLLRVEATGSPAQSLEQFAVGGSESLALALAERLVANQGGRVEEEVDATRLGLRIRIPHQPDRVCEDLP